MKKSPRSWLASSKKRGIDINTGCKVEKIEKIRDGATVSYTGRSRQAQTKTAEKVLVAVWRGPRTYDAALTR